jgi:hypothetical protein
MRKNHIKNKIPKKETLAAGGGTAARARRPLPPPPTPAAPKNPHPKTTEKFIPKSTI